MKKPDITPGPWKIKHEFHVVGERTVASCGGYFNNLDSENVRKQNEANARAISAVPDMLDALMEAKRQLDIVQGYHGYSTSVAATIEEIEEALEKAGVTI